MGFSKISTLLSAALMAGSALAIDPIVMKGTKFFFQNGTQFFIKGVAYQQGVGAAGATSTNSSFIDPLSDATLCKRDVPFLADLGTNVIRTYAIDPTANHDECMSLLQAAGIYVISDLSNPTVSINRDDPAWTTDLFAHYKAVVDSLSKYNNVIGFFAGNEVTNNASNTQASAFVKAAVRDTKAYIKSKNIRWMGVGYAANDDADIRANIAHYFNCGNQEDAIDYWGYNIYEWCGQSSFEKSGYKDQVDFFSNFSVPVFFAEYGCNTVGGAAGRIFQETGELYSSDMTGVISGGIVYMYFEEANDYGLVSIASGQVSTMADYNALKTQVAAATPSSTNSAAYTPTNSPAACPPIGKTWQAAEALPPTPDETTCNCMFSTLSCVPASDLKATAYGAIFGYICGQSASACAGISANTSTGVYGAFSMCSAEQKLGYVLNQYYKSQSSASSACDFNGQAVVTKPVGAASTCSAALSSASAANSVAATATKGTAASSSTGAAPGVRPTFSWAMGDLAVGLYMLVAVGFGAGMVML